MRGLERSLACRAAHGNGLRPQASARNVLAAIRADAVAAFGHALLCLLDVLEPRAIDLDLGAAQVVDARRLRLVGVAADLVIRRLHSRLDHVRGPAKLLENVALQWQRCHLGR
jgi:hypothetical protein